MRYAGKRRWIKILTIFVLSCIMLQNNNTAFAKSKGDAIPEKEEIIIGEGEGAQEYETISTEAQYAGTSSHCSFPLIQWDNIWMAPAKTIFSDVLGCYYQYSKEEKSVLITSPDKENSVKYTLNSKSALVNNKEESLPTEIILVSKKDSEKSDYMIPLDFTMQSLGYTYSVQEEKTDDGTVSYHLLEIQQKYLYYITAADLSYDKEAYNNMLIGVVLQENTALAQNMIQGFTLESTSKKNVKIVQSAADYSVTMQFLNTYNPFGTVTKSIKNGTTKSIKIWETDDKTTCVQINYNQKKEYTSEISKDGGMITLSKGSFSMKVLLPDKVTYSQITTTDQYWNQKFLIIVPGNQVSFYKEHAPVDNSSSVTKISVSQTSDKRNTQIVVTTKGLKGYKLEKGSGYFTVCVGNPKDIYQNIVLIDAGHGGADPGKVGIDGSLEKDINLKIAMRLKSLLEAQDIKVVMTRTDEGGLYDENASNKKVQDMKRRIAIIEEAQPAAVVSIHQNSYHEEYVHGAQVFYYETSKTGKELAQLIQNRFVVNVDPENRREAKGNNSYYLLKKTSRPIVIVECGFLSNRQEAEKLNSEEYQEKAAWAIHMGILQYLNVQ